MTKALQPRSIKLRTDIRHNGAIVRQGAVLKTVPYSLAQELVASGRATYDLAAQVSAKEPVAAKPNPALGKREKALAAAEAEQAKRQQALDEREAALDEQEAALNEREAALDAREAELTAPDQAAK